MNQWQKWMEWQKWLVDYELTIFNPSRWNIFNYKIISLGQGRYRNRDFVKSVSTLLAVQCCETLKLLCYKSA